MPLDRTPWEDDTVMPWGKHKGTKLVDVPATYLLWLLEQKWIKDWPGLHDYLKRCEDDMLEETQGEREHGEAEDIDSIRSFEDYRRDYRGF